MNDYKFNTWYTDENSNYTFCTDIPGRSSRYIGWYLNNSSHQAEYEEDMPGPEIWKIRNYEDDPFLEFSDQFYIIRTLFGAPY